MDAKQLLNESENYKAQLIDNRHYLHEHPGTGFDTEETIAYVKSELSAMDYDVKECGKAGLTATVGKGDGKVFLIRADMDALPIKEESGVEFASQNGRMHACGHDMHTAMLLGAARLLKEHENEIEGTVKLMFQSAEEIFEGAGDMIKAGVLENPKVDAALMIHVMAGVPIPVGTVIVSAPGVSAPAADYFEIKVQGKGCHGSMPNTGADPINAAAHILIALQEINARELAVSDRAVLTVGTINGGTASNVIPDTVTMGGSLRTYDEETRGFIKKRMTEIAEGTAAAFRTKAEVTFGSGCPTLINNEELSADAEKYVRELLGNEKTLSAAQMNSGGLSKTAGSEDFAHVSQEVPSIMLALAAGEPEKGYKYPQHHPQVKFDEEALTAGCAVYAYTAMRWLEEHK